MKQFYNAWPKRAENPLYIYGISYGGIYAPYLALAIHHHNQEVKMKTGTSTIHINLKGFIVGNGGTDWLTDPFIGTIDTANAHNLLSSDVYNKWKSSGCLFAWDGLRQNLPPPCEEIG